MHCQPDELVDVVEGTRPESSLPHLSSCADCRQQLADLRSVMTAVAEVDVPAPSPLFWDHLSARVREAVAEEPAPRRAWYAWVLQPRFFVPLAAAAALVIVIGVVRQNAASGLLPTIPAVSQADLLHDPSSGDDQSLKLLADLTESMDLDTAHEAGLAPRGSADHAVVHLSNAELRELRRLLQQEMGDSGA